MSGGGTREAFVEGEQRMIDCYKYIECYQCTTIYKCTDLLSTRVTVFARNFDIGGREFVKIGL